MALGLILIRFDFFYRKILRKRSFAIRFFAWTSLILILSIIGLCKLILSRNHHQAIKKQYIYIEPYGGYFRRSSTCSDEQKDWNNYELIKEEMKRTGFGEHGSKTVTEGKISDAEIQMMKENGHNAIVSNRISLDRSVPDFRSDTCKKKLHKKDLPTVSVIMPFYDEHLTTLLRSIHSIMKRSPPELLEEIIVVNDASSKWHLQEDLQSHIEVYGWQGKVKLLMMDQRSGLIWSRLAGARYAIGDVLLFVDCHIEVGHNFLPPLIEPISDDYRTVVVPTLDVIDKITYEIRPLKEGRTVFDWNFHVQRIPLKNQTSNESELLETPVLYGAAFAISQKYFWELKPDSGLQVYGGDQIEMSLKINLCNGKLYESPCSRIAHIYRRFPYQKQQDGVDFKVRNNKRVAEIWLDVYKQYFLKRHPERYAKIDIGDISEQLALKKSLNCKSFSFFLKEIAPDMLDRFPLEDYEPFASGLIRNQEIQKCLQVEEKGFDIKVNLADCNENLSNSLVHQNFTLRHFRDLTIEGKSDCLEHQSGHEFSIARCHYEQGKQYFRYNLDTLQLVYGPKRYNLCVDANYGNMQVFLNNCDKEKKTQKWKFGFARVSLLRNWIEKGAKILDEKEIQDLLAEN